VQDCADFIQCEGVLVTVNKTTWSASTLLWEIRDFERKHSFARTNLRWEQNLEIYVA